jgi:hypothetical protein
MRLKNGLFTLLLILVANVALSEPLHLHAPVQCIDMLPMDARLEGSSPTVRAFAWQTLSAARFDSLRKGTEGLPADLAALIAQSRDYEAFRAHVLALPAAAAARLAPEQAAWLVANRLPPAASAEFFRCVNADALLVQPAEPVADDQPVSLRVHWTDLPADSPATVRWAAVNLVPLTPLPEHLSASGELTVSFTALKGQSATLLVEAWTVAGPIRAQFIAPAMPLAVANQLAATHTPPD